MSWLKDGLLVGTLLGSIEVAVAAVSGFNLPVVYLLAVFAFDVAGGLVVGLLAAGLARVVRVSRATFMGRFTPLGTAVVFVYAIDKVGLAAVVRERPAWWGVATLIPLAVGGCAMAGRALARVRHTRAVETSVIVSMTLLMLAMIVARFVTRSLFPSILAARPIALAALLFLAALAAIVAQDRWWGRDDRRAPSPLVAVLLIHALAASAALWGFFHSRPRDAPAAPVRARRPAVGKPNVVLVVIDTLRADRVSAYGYSRDTTPALSGLAREGVLFRNAIAPGNWTVPSTASLLTGTFPVTHGALQMDNAALHPANTTLAEILADAGYRTGAVVSNDVALGTSGGFDQGFAFYDARPYRRPGYQAMLSGFLLPFPMAFGGDLSPWRPGSEINRRAFAWLDANARAPFFLFVNYMEPHDPYAPPAPFTDRYPGRRLLMPPIEGEIMREHRTLSTEEEEHFRAQYDAEVACADASLSALLDRLRQLGAYDDTLVIVTSDHGEFFGEHQLMMHATGPYDPVHRVPLVVRYPRGRVRGEEQRYVQLVDVLPTVLDVLGLPIPAFVQGSALPAAHHPVIVEAAPNPRFVRMFGGRFARGYEGLYSDGWKLVSHSDGEAELYDLRNDPGERRNLAAAHPEEVARLRSVMEGYRASLPQLARTGIDAERRRALQGAGYLP
jgi:arylsulfatase A-like enzyme